MGEPPHGVGSRRNGEKGKGCPLWLGVTIFGNFEPSVNSHHAPLAPIESYLVLGGPVLLSFQGIATEGGCQSYFPLGNP